MFKLDLEKAEEPEIKLEEGYIRLYIVTLLIYLASMQRTSCEMLD